MNKVHLEWDQDAIRLTEVPLSRHPLLETRGVFALVSARLDEPADLWRDLSLLHIAVAHTESLRVAIERPNGVREAAAAKVGERPGHEIIVMLGSFGECTLKRKTREFIADLEACLRGRNSIACLPEGASLEVKADVSVVNHGNYAPLNWRSLSRAAKK